MRISDWSSDVCSSDLPTGRELPAGTFEAEAEGVALWSCTPDIGYWVAADQRYPQTHFLLFERESLAPRGSFMGEVTAHTDGIALHAAATTAFPYGALFAVHDAEAVAAFVLGDVVRALAVDPPRPPYTGPASGRYRGFYIA